MMNIERGMNMAIIEKTLYVTSDGKEFDSRERAEKYDKELKKLSGFYAANMYQESVLICDVRKKFREIYYVELLSNEAFDFYKKFCDENYIKCPESLGIWKYDPFLNEWYSLDDEIKKFLEGWENAVKHLNLKITYNRTKGAAKG